MAELDPQEQQTTAEQPAIYGQGGSQTTPETQQTAPETTPNLLDRLKSKGIDTSGFQDEDSALDYIAKSTREASRIPDLEKHAYYGQQYLAKARDIARWEAEDQRRKQEEQQKTQVESKKKLWDRPEYDPSWEQHVRYDAESGQYVGINQWVPPNIVQGFNQYRTWQRGAVDKLLEDPFALMQNGLQEWVDTRAGQKAQEALQQYHLQRQNDWNQQYANDIVQRHSDWLHSRDSNGKITIDSRGFPILTEKGQAYAKAVDRLEKSGVQDQDTVDQLALLMIGHKAATEDTATTTQKTPQAENRRERFLEKAAGRGLAGGANVEGTLTSNEGQNGRDAFMEMALKEAKAKGIKVA